MQPLKDVGHPAFCNMSFHEFENFVNMSAVISNDYQTLFMNQVAEFNRIFAKVGNNDNKCKAINKKVNFLRYLQNLIDLNVKVTNTVLDEFENALTPLERLGNLSTGSMDELRLSVYPLILQINETMTTLVQKLGIIANEANKTKKAGDKKILDKHLKLLELLQAALQKLKQASGVMKNKNTIRKYLNVDNVCIC